jgi:hypothetical protein
MDDPYTELAGCVIRLKEEIVELTAAVLHLASVMLDE